MRRNIFSNILKPVGEFVHNVAGNMLSDITGQDPSDIWKGLSDTIFGTHYGDSDLMLEQDVINDENARVDRDWKERMLSEDRAYNSPANQMQLLRNAGLNPALMYGQMSNIGGTAPSSTASSVGLGSAQHGNLLGFDMLSSAQAQLLRSEANKNNVEADVMQQKLPEELNQLRISNQQLQTQIDALNQEIKESARRIQSMDIDDQVKLATKARIEFQSVMDDKQFQQSLKEWETNQRYINQKIRESQSVESKNYAERDLTINELKEQIESWSYRLLGFDLQNQQVIAATGLTYSQLNGQEHQNVLSGFQINAGYAEDVLNSETNAKLRGEKGWFIKFRTKNDQKLIRMLKQVAGTGNLLFRVGK